MKYVHTDGVEYEVAELAKSLHAMAHGWSGPYNEAHLLAAAALLARHEMVCEALEPFATLPVGDELPLNMDDVLHAWHVKGGTFELRQQDIKRARAALRGEEAPRG